MSVLTSPRAQSSHALAPAAANVPTSHLQQPSAVTTPLRHVSWDIIVPFAQGVHERLPSTSVDVLPTAQRLQGVLLSRSLSWYLIAHLEQTMDIVGE